MERVPINAPQGPLGLIFAPESTVLKMVREASPLFGRGDRSDSFFEAENGTAFLEDPVALGYSVDDSFAHPMSKNALASKFGRKHFHMTVYNATNVSATADPRSLVGRFRATRAAAEPRPPSRPAAPAALAATASASCAMPTLSNAAPLLMAAPPPAYASRESSSRASDSATESAPIMP